MIKKRIITSLVLILFFFSFYFIPLPFKFLIFVGLIMKASQEMMILFHKVQDHPKFFLSKFIIVFLATLFLFLIFLLIFIKCDIITNKFLPANKSSYLFLRIPLLAYLDSFFLVLYPFVLILFILILFPFWNSEDVGKTFLIMVYVGAGMACLFILMLLNHDYLLCFVGTVVLTDSFALLGRFQRFCCFLGKRPLAFHISPNKTQKGAILGVLGSTLTICFITYLRRGPSFFILPFFISIISQISDLIASKFKRDCGIKDFGNMFPGHGGFLDRFDSWLFSSFFTLLLFSYFNLC